MATRTSTKRIFCEHCKEFVSLRTYRQHVDLYYNKSVGEWLNDGSSDDEVGQMSQATFVDDTVHNDSYDATHVEFELDQNDSQQSLQGVMIEDLEEEDVRLISDVLLDDSEDDLPHACHGMMGPAIHNEVWTMTEEEIENDFRQCHRLPSIDANQAPHFHEKAKSIVHWMLLFICLWSSFCSISDNALNLLISFIRTLFDSIATIFPLLTSFAVMFPTSLHMLRKQLGLDKDKFIKYVVCPKCDSLYSFDDSYILHNGKRVSNKCSFVAFPNHKQTFRRTKCEEPLLKEVYLQNGTTKLYPFKVYCYNSVITQLRSFIQRPGFSEMCEEWRDRNIPDGFLADVFDGKIWKEWQNVDGIPFLSSPRKYAFMLNVDWFQPFKHSIYSVGVLYMVLMNLPRAERFKPENVFLVGIIPGPCEPKLHINSFLQPLVAELNLLWKDGIKVVTTCYGSKSEHLFHAALLCVGCDIPATRKVCGFTGHASRQGCSKCKKMFPGSVSTRMDFSGFTPSIPRNNQEHREEAQDILNQTSSAEKNAKEQVYGSRFSELMSIPYFDCVRFHIIDPMHNLFTGTAKHVMKNIWLNPESPLLGKEILRKIQTKVDKVKVPSNVGRMPKKIENCYGGFTADQWKNFTILFSIYSLWNVLPTADLDVWRSFVLACSFLCSPVITETRAMIGNTYLLTFCQGIEDLYGNHRVTPNMHLHMHLLDCILDYGPVYSFWLFSFERYNGILGQFGTNQRAVEIQLMRRFMTNHFLIDIPLPTVFNEHFQPFLDQLVSRQAGSLHDQSEHDCTSGRLILSSLLSIGPLIKDNMKWICDGTMYVCCPPFARHCLDVDFLLDLKTTYKAIFEAVDESSITCHFERYSSFKFGGDKYGSANTRDERSSFILARWCKLGGEIDMSGSDLRPGVVDYYMKQNVKVNNQYVSCVLASVRWFQVHPSRFALGAPVEVWCKELYELDGPASFIPIQRIYGKFIPAFDIVQKENVLITCPLPHKLQC